jgi:toxoflavin synthase
MASQYDRLGREFGKVEGLPIRRFVELPSFFEILGDVRGKSVLDVGCGTGIYTRLLKARGAARVVGLDVSTDMIEAARRAELAEPAGIEYVIRDLANAGALGPFDAVTASYVIHHASTTEEIRAMCKGIHDALRPGGRFVGTMMSYDFQSTDPGYYDRYGIRLAHDGSLRDGGPLDVILDTGQGQLTLSTHYWTKEGYESAFASAGLSRLRWRAPHVSPEGVEQHGAAFWEPYILRPHSLVLEAFRP